MTNTYRLNVYPAGGYRVKKTDSKKLETALNNFEFYLGEENIDAVEIVNRETNEVIKQWSACGSCCHASPDDCQCCSHRSSKY